MKLHEDAAVNHHMLLVLRNNTHLEQQVRLTVSVSLRVRSVELSLSSPLWSGGGSPGGGAAEAAGRHDGQFAARWAAEENPTAAATEHQP